MKRLAVKLAGIALVTALGASAAHAQTSRPSLFAGQAKAVAARAGLMPGPSVVIKQEGRGNGAAADQNGISNAIRIIQNGGFNNGQIKQDGVNNTGSIYQFGKNNDATITQTGANNAACVVQLGRNNSADVVQTGGQSIGVVQTRAGAYEFPAVLCDVDPRNPNMLRRAVRAAF